MMVKLPIFAALGKSCLKANTQMVRTYSYSSHY